MPVDATDMKLFESSVMPASFATADIGGGIGVTAISSASVGQVHFTMSSLAASGGNLVQHSKIFDLNDHATDSVENYGGWIENAIDSIASAALISFASSSASDDATTTLLIVGKSAGGAAQTETLAMNGLSTVTTSLQYLGGVRVFTTATTGGAYKDAVGIITITASASTIGIIPAGLYSATAEIDIGLEPNLDDTETTDDAETPPTGVAFTKPRTGAGKLVYDDGAGVLLAGEAQGIWSRLTLGELMNPSASVQVSIVGGGDPV